MKKKPPSIRVATIIDAWFPTHHPRHGVWGGGQVHVRKLTQVLERLYPVNFTLFFPARPNLIYKFLWIAIATTRVVQSHKRQPFNLIHAHGINASLVGKLVSLLLKLPLVQTVHGSNLMDLKSKSLKAWFEKIIFTKLKYAAQISISSSFLKYQNINQHPVIIPNGVNIEEFDAIQTQKNELPTLIWVGQDNPTKGISVLRASILKIRKIFPELKTKLITGGALTGKALIKAYKKAHVFVLPSLAEGQPITLLEAWAAKLPVVVTNVGDNSLMVKNGINGYLVDPGNVNQLTSAILKTLRARTKNEQMGEAGYQLVKDQFTWTHVARQTWKVYQQVLVVKKS